MEKGGSSRRNLCGGEMRGFHGAGLGLVRKVGNFAGGGLGAGEQFFFGRGGGAAG